MPHFRSLIEHSVGKMSNSRALQGGIRCLSYINAWLYVKMHVQVCWMCICVYVHLPCVGVWDAEGDLSAEGAERQSIRLTEVFSSSPLVICVGGGMLPAQAEEEPGEYGHTGLLMLAFAVFFYDTWQDNESLAPFKIPPISVSFLCISSEEEWILF